MLVLFSAEFKHLGSFKDEQEKAVLGSAPAGAMLAKASGDLAQLDVEQLGALYMSFDPEDGAEMAAKLTKNPSHLMKVSVAKKIWAEATPLVKDVEAPHRRAADQVAVTTKEEAEHHHKEGVSAKIRKIMEDNPDKPKVEILALCAAAGLNAATASTQYSIIKKSLGGSTQENTPVVHISVEELRKKHPVTTAILEALKHGGTRAEILSMAEHAVSGNSIPSNSLKATFTYILPALQIAGVVSCDEAFKTIK